MNEPLYAVYGAAGCGRGVMPLLRDSLFASGTPLDQIVFVDDAPNLDQLNGHRVLGYDSFLSEEASERAVVVAIADSNIRQKISNRLEQDGVRTLSVQANNVVIMDDVEIGPGAILSPFVTLTSNIRIGKAFQANLYSYVEHDCVIGDFVTFAPNVHCNGNVVIEDHAYIGTGAVIRQGKPGAPLIIGEGATIGMGAVVTKSIPAGATVVGIPARPMGSV